MAGGSLRGKVFNKIREDILKGRYKKGDELVECTIGKELGVSRTPVREAIRQLELEGLVSSFQIKVPLLQGFHRGTLWICTGSGQSWRACAQLWQQSMPQRSS